MKAFFRSNVPSSTNSCAKMKQEAQSSEEFGDDLKAHDLNAVSNNREVIFIRIKLYKN